MSGNGWEQARAHVEMLRREGHTDEDIREMMFADGWEEDELEAVWQDLGSPVPRPASVSLVVAFCLMWALCGLSLGMVLGMMLLVASLGAMRMGPPKLAHVFIFAWMAISVGILVVGHFLWNGSNWARITFMVLLGLSGLNCVLGLVVGLAQGGLNLSSVVLVLEMAVCGLFIFILNGNDAREYCTR